MLGNAGSDDWSAKLIGNWIHNFDEDGTMFTLNVGGEIKHGNLYSRYLYATGFLSDELADIAYATNYPSGNTPSGSEDVTASVGAFVAANFIYKGADGDFNSRKFFPDDGRDTEQRTSGKDG